MKNLYSGFNYTLKLTFIIVTSTLLMQGCASVGIHDITAEEMNIKASALTKLSYAVETVISIDMPDESVSDEDILRISTEDDPLLIEPFANYSLKINRDDGHAVILMCNKEATVGLLEDAGCTGKMDKHLWKISNGCKFTINALKVCN